MMQRQVYLKTILLIVSISFFLAALAAAQEKVWVVGKDAKLKADMTASSATVAVLPLGMELTVESSQGRWYKVATPSRETGWIYRGKVSQTPPPQESGGLFGTMSGGSGIKVSAADTSRSIRGLSPEAQEYARISGTPQTYRNALDGVLAMETSASEVERFLKDGRIGEYAP
ncbi:MAG: SH3 domain-containing protein [Desulfobacterales bacterium]|nr:MAG: SH3 domain-containing protein [Desulfobacterales bacterium]